MSLLFAALRWLVARLSVVLVAFAVVYRAAKAWRRRRGGGFLSRRARRDVLPSLFDRHPGASAAPRRRLGLRSVPIDRIVGTMRHPSQNTADFLPLPKLRGTNWRARWQRINRAMSALQTLPPVDLIQVGDEYYVEDGHNRVAAARSAGAIEVDAAVTQLLLPGETLPDAARAGMSSLVDTDAVRQAGRGQFSRTVEQRPAVDALSREQLLRDTDEAP